MSGKAKKVIVGVLVAVVGLPVAFVSALLAWGYFSDTTNGSLVSSDVKRRYLLYVPKAYNRSKSTPLVISLHPAATWPAFEENISRWNDLADERGFIVVYPAGTGAFFDTFTRGQSVWPMGPHSLGRDVKFISDLIDKLEGEYNIDPNRIYANGMSNGGGMAFALSCELPDRIAAVGVVAGAHIGPWKCREPRPVPTVAFHGTADEFAAYQGGDSPVAPGPLANIPDWTAHVAQRDQCQGKPSETRISPSVRLLVYSNCADNTDVALYTIEGGGHTWPGGKHVADWLLGRTTDEINATRIMWQFFLQHPLIQTPR